mgnify:CR=1 FL=1
MILMHEQEKQGDKLSGSSHSAEDRNSISPASVQDEAFKTKEEVMVQCQRASAYISHLVKRCIYHKLSKGHRICTLSFSLVTKQKHLDSPKIHRILCTTQANVFPLKTVVGKQKYTNKG